MYINVKADGVYKNDSLTISNYRKDGKKSGWESIRDYALGCGAKADEEIWLDFIDIEVSRPWEFPEVIDLMKDDRVRLKFYNSDDMVETLKMNLMLHGVKVGDRIISEKRVYREVTAPKIPQRVVSKINGISKLLESDGDTINIPLHKYISQFSSDETLEALNEIIKKLYEENKAKKVIIDLGWMVIARNIKQKIGEIPVYFEQKGMEIELRSSDSNTQDDLILAQNTARNGVFDSANRYKCIRANLRKGTVGMLARYKETIGKDLFGRMGDGIPVKCMPAIYLGIAKDKKGKQYVKFRWFNLDTFSTKIDYSLDHDGEPHKGVLNYNDIFIDVEDLGIYEWFIGALFHFSEPIQVDKDEYFVSYVSDGSNIRTVKRNLAEHIKDVLDDFDINYDKGRLEGAIKKTNEYLNNSNKEN